MAYNNHFRHRRPAAQLREQDVVLVEWYEDVYYVTSWSRGRPITRDGLVQALADTDDPFESAEEARTAAEAMQQKLGGSAQLLEISIEDYPPELPPSLADLYLNDDAGQTGQTKEKTHAEEAPKGKEAPKGNEPPKGNEAPKGNEPPKGNEAPKGMELPKGNEPPKGMEPPKSKGPSKSREPIPVKENPQEQKAVPQEKEVMQEQKEN